jgi:pimeloyl-ACP methyl ester carboxylesterase
VDGTATLPDGRTLHYREYGTRAGVPVLLFADIGQSTLARHPDERLTASADVRLIAVDRPGIAGSALVRGRTLLQWPEDVRMLADALRLERFGVLGWGWGAAYALACAVVIPEQIDGTGLVSALGGPVTGRDGVAPVLGPQIRSLSGIARLPGPAARWALRRRRTAVRRGPRGVLEGMPGADHDVLHIPAITAMLEDSMAEAWDAGIDGVYADLRTAGHAWGFRPEDVTRPVYLWYGEGDTEFPPAMQHALAERIPRCRATAFPGDGHLALFARWEEIMGSMAAAAG